MSTRRDFLRASASAALLASAASAQSPEAGSGAAISLNGRWEFRLDPQGRPGTWRFSAEAQDLESQGRRAGAVSITAAGEGLDPRACLAANDTHAFLSAAGDLIVTGPTGTNVNDITFVLVEP